MPTILNHICQKLEKTAASVVCLTMGNDRDYFVSRAEEEEARAAKCDDASAQDAHLRLAEYYRQAAENRGPQPLSDRQTRPTLTIMSGAAGTRSRPAGQ